MIEGCLVVDEIGLQWLTGEGGVERIGHQVRVIPTALDIATQLLVKLGHATILPPACSMLPTTGVAAAAGPCFIL